MSTQKSQRNLFGWRRAALAFGAVCLMLLAALLISPSARALANAQFRQIGALIFREASGASIDSATATPLPPTTAPPQESDGPQQVASIDEASELAGFTVLTPTYLPVGYIADGDWSVARQESGIYVTRQYRHQEGQQFLILNQNMYASGATFEQVYADNETVVDITVDGQPGVWITGRLMTDPDPDARPDLQATNWLVWQNGAITYVLFGNSLSQASMMQIATSLGR